MALFGSSVGGLKGTELLFSRSQFTFVSVNLTLDLLRDGLAHLLLGHVLERIHLFCKALEPVANFSTLEAELRFNLSANLRFSLSNVDEGFVAHDLLALVQLALKLGSDLFFLPRFEGLKALLHLNFQFKSGFFLEEVEVGFMRQALVAQLRIDF